MSYPVIQRYAAGYNTIPYGAVFSTAAVFESPGYAQINKSKE
jgi:hypothetical protein